MKYKCVECDFTVDIPNRETENGYEIWTLPPEAKDHLFFAEHHGFYPVEPMKK